jgi:hypothetical protein
LENIIIRAGQNLWEDREFDISWKASKGVLPRGSYWFFDGFTNKGVSMDFKVMDGKRITVRKEAKVGSLDQVGQLGSGKGFSGEIVAHTINEVWVRLTTKYPNAFVAVRYGGRDFATLANGMPIPAPEIPEDPEDPEDPPADAKFAFTFDEEAKVIRISAEGVPLDDWEIIVGNSSYIKAPAG